MNKFISYVGETISFVINSKKQKITFIMPVCLTVRSYPKRFVYAIYEFG